MLWRSSGGVVQRHRWDCELVGLRPTVGTGEVSFDAIPTGYTAVATNFARATWQAGLALARSAADGICRHGSGPPQYRSSLPISVSHSLDLALSLSLGGGGKWDEELCQAACSEKKARKSSIGRSGVDSVVRDNER